MKNELKVMFSSDINDGSGKLSSLTKVKGGQRAVWCSHYGMDSSTTPPQLNDIVHALKIDLCTHVAHVIVAVYYDILSLELILNRSNWMQNGCFQT